MALVSISEAARLTGKSRTTIHRYMKQGKLSSVQGVTGQSNIDISELIRIFGELSSVTLDSNTTCNNEQHVTGSVTPNKTNDQRQSALLEQEIKYLKQLLDEKEKHILSLKEEVSHHRLLIEDKSKANKKKWFFF